jgi:hypothetical protein
MEDVVERERGAFFAGLSGAASLFDGRAKGRVAILSNVIVDCDTSSL